MRRWDALAFDGHLQAKKIGERPKNDPIAAIYTTTLQRIHQTAAPLANHLGFASIVEPDLREIHLGD